jgi:hypothetical protein
VNQNLAKSVPLLRFLQVQFLIWSLTFLVGGMERWVLHLPEMFWYPFFLRAVRFTDLTIYQDRFDYFHQAKFFTLPGFPFTYPAPVAFAYKMVFFFGLHAVAAYISICLAAFSGAAFLLGRRMRRIAPASELIAFFWSTLLLSYPFWFMVDRANIEIFVWLLLASGVAVYWNKKWYLAAILLGIATSFKIFPFVFIGLLLSARRYRATVLAVFTAAFTTFASTWMLGPTYKIASEGISQGLQYFRVMYMLNFRASEIGFDHSAFSVIKQLLPKSHVSPEQYYKPWLSGYLLVAAAAGLILYFWKIRSLPRINQVLALTVASILLPPGSGDYTLVHLYIAWALLVLVAICSKDARGPHGLTLCFICMAILMSPESFLFIHGVRIAGQFKAIILLVLLVISVVCPFEDPVLEQKEEQLVAVAAGEPG